MDRFINFKIIRLWAALAYSFILLGLLIFSRSLQENKNVYERSLTAQDTTNIGFEKLKNSEIHDVKLVYCSNKNCNKKADKTAAFGGIAPSVSLFDFNQDGYLDITLTDPGSPNPIRFFKNNKALQFEEFYPMPTKTLAEIKDKVSIVGWSYLGSPQKPYLIVAPWGCVRAYEWSPQKESFIKETIFEDGALCGRVQSINVADLNHDGSNEIILANYSSKKGFLEPMDNHRYGDKERGEKNEIISFDGENYQIKTVSDDRDYTWGVGVAYINNDELPDLLFTNDFSTDVLYLNEKEKFVDVTKDWLDLSYHGYAGMNSDFADFDNDGDLDLYITNVYSVPFYPMGNNLWVREGNTFKYSSVDYGMRRCGWSWAAKFIDFDLDGQDELFVSSGRYYGGESQSDPEVKSYWYYWIHERSTPTFFRTLLLGLDYKSNQENQKFEMAGRERNCLFKIDKDKVATDISIPAGLGEFKVTRTVATGDLNNDGLIDMVLGHYGDGYEVYINKSQTQNSWVGFRFFDRLGQENSNGLRVKWMLNDKVIKYKEIFSFNGLRAQSESKISFPINPNKIKDYKMLLIWPSGQTKLVDQFEASKYNLVYEDESAL